MPSILIASDETKRKFLDAFENAYSYPTTEQRADFRRGFNAALMVVGIYEYVPSEIWDKDQQKKYRD